MLDRATIISALARLASLLHARGVEGELCLLGSTGAQFLLEELIEGEGAGGKS